MPLTLEPGIPKEANVQLTPSEPPSDWTVVITSPIDGYEHDLGDSLRVAWTFGQEFNGVHGVTVEIAKPGDVYRSGVTDKRWIQAYECTISGDWFNVPGTYGIRVRPSEGYAGEVSVVVPEPPAPPVTEFFCPGVLWDYAPCGQSFNTREELVQHIADPQHYHVKFWDWVGGMPHYYIRCPYCDFRFQGDAVLIARAYLDHIEEKHELICSVCGEHLTYAGFWTERGLAWQSHMETVHGAAPPPSIEVVPLWYLEHSRDGTIILTMREYYHWLSGISVLPHPGSSDIIRVFNPTQYVLGDAHVTATPWDASDRAWLRIKVIIPELEGRSWTARLVSYDMGSYYYGRKPTYHNLPNGLFSDSGAVIKWERRITLAESRNIGVIDLIVDYDSERLIVPGLLVRSSPPYWYTYPFDDYDDRWANP